MTNDKKLTWGPVTFCGWDPDDPPCFSLEGMGNGTVRVGSTIRPGEIIISDEEFKNLMAQKTFEAGGLLLTKLEDDLYSLARADGVGDTIIYDQDEVDRFWEHLAAGTYAEQMMPALV